MIQGVPNVLNSHLRGTVDTTAAFQQEQHTYENRDESVEIKVTPFYVKERSSPEHSQYFYAYKVTMTNYREESIKLVHRHWKIKDGKGKHYEVQGSGVVGEQPVLMPGESYEYQSFCPLHSPFGNMRGKFQFIDQFGQRFWATVPVFFFRPPSELLQ